jgi:hypothetical protein
LRCSLSLAILLMMAFASVSAFPSPPASRPMSSDAGSTPDASSSASRPLAPDSPLPSSAEDLVMGQPEVKSWSALVFHAGRSVASRVDTSEGGPRCVDVTLYEDAGPYLTRFGTWTVCGTEVLRHADDY